MESIGVPHTEIDLIIANGNSVGFDYNICEGDFISVYPVFESIDISPVIRLRPEPLRNTAFILDVHIGKLARLLRMAGFDALYRNNFEDSEIISTALSEKRIILTKDRGILKNRSVTHGYWVRENEPVKQFHEIIKRFDLINQVKPFSRCIECNMCIERIDKEKVLYRLKPRTAKYFEEFYYCAGCDRVYWKGSHYNQMKKKIEKIIQYRDFHNGKTKKKQIKNDKRRTSK